MSSGVIVFDLDDTLFAESEFVCSGFRAVDLWLKENRGISGFFERAHALYRQGIRGNIFNLALANTELEAAEYLDPLVALYRGHTPQLTLLPDAAWALDYCASFGTLGLITDGYAQTQRNKVAALGIARRFAATVYSDDWGKQAWKPSLIPYQKMMEMTDALPESCVYIGDNPNKDFIGARTMGWRSIHIVRPEGEYGNAKVDARYEADCRIDTLYALEGML